jgi:hypothetical protein
VKVSGLRPRAESHSICTGLRGRLSLLREPILITVVFLNLLATMSVVGLVVGLLSQPVRGVPVFSTCFLSDRSMSLQMRSEMSRISPKASMRSSDLRYHHAGQIFFFECPGGGFG